MQLLKLVKADGIKPIKNQSSKEEYLSYCPGCCGHNTFIIWKNNNRYFCSNCWRRGDTVQYLRDFHALSYRKACLKVGRNSSDAPHTSLWRPLPAMMEQENIVTKNWQPAALEFVLHCHKKLMASHSVLSELFERGFTLGTIEKNFLGWNDKECWLNKKGLLIPCGVVVPTFVKEQLCKVRVLDAKSKYVAVAGNDEALSVYGEGAGKPVVVVEAELEAMLVQQFAGDICCVIALGGAKRLGDVVLQTPLVLFAVDDVGMYQQWQIKHPGMLFWPSPGGLNADVTLRKWVLEGLHARR